MISVSRIEVSHCDRQESFSHKEKKIRLRRINTSPCVSRPCLQKVFRKVFIEWWSRMQPGLHGHLTCTRDRGGYAMYDACLLLSSLVERSRECNRLFDFRCEQTQVRTRCSLEEGGNTDSGYHRCYLRLWIDDLRLGNWAWTIDANSAVIYLCWVSVSYITNLE